MIKLNQIYRDKRGEYIKIIEINDKLAMPIVGVDKNKNIHLYSKRGLFNPNIFSDRDLVVPKLFKKGNLVEDQNIVLSVLEDVKENDTTFSGVIIKSKIKDLYIKGYKSNNWGIYGFQKYIAKT